MATRKTPAKAGKTVDAYPGIVQVAATSAAKALPQFIKAIAAHRYFERQMDPPAV